MTKSPPWLMERKIKYHTTSGPIPFCERASKTVWERCKKIPARNHWQGFIILLLRHKLRFYFSYFGNYFFTNISHKINDNFPI